MMSLLPDKLSTFKIVEQSFTSTYVLILPCKLYKGGKGLTSCKAVVNIRWLIIHSWNVFAIVTESILLLYFTLDKS